MADDKPIIVIKKKGGHGGHHGGAWKIAYADFVTAMMAFFMVMWLVNSASETTRQNIASYFRKPGIFNEGSGMPLLIGGQGILSDAFVPPRPEDKKKIKNPTDDPSMKLFGESDKDLDKHYMQEGRQEPQRHKGPDQIMGLNSDKKAVEDIKRQVKLKQISEEAESKLKQMLKTMPDIAKMLGKVEMKLEEDGLKIEIMDTDKVSMFDSGSSRIRKEAEPAFAKVVEVIKQYPNALEISGHTDGKPFQSRTGGYTNWELSSDRANSARRLIESQGFPAQQVQSVEGRASSELKVPEDPLAPANRRITLKVKFDPTKEALAKSVDGNSSNLATLLANPADATPDPNATVTPTPTPSPSPTPTPTATPAAPPAGPTRIHARSPSNRIVLPDGTPLTTNPDYMPRDKIFENNPVLGPTELYRER